MRRGKADFVRKRDGSLERFSLPKLHRCLNTTLSASGLNGDLAMPLAEAVTIHVRQLDGCRCPSTEFIFQAVCEVLCETGLCDAAEHLRSHRERRLHRRQQVHVFVVSAGGSASVPWSKPRVVTSLQRRFGLGQIVARFLAAEIEAKVFRLNYRCLSGALVAALIRNELAAWGLLDDAGSGTGGAAERNAVTARRRESEEND